MSKKKISKPTPKPAPVNAFDDLFSKRKPTEGVAYISIETAKGIAIERAEDDKRLAEESGEKYEEKKYKPTRTLPLEVIRTLFLDESDWNLRTATIARMKADPRVIMVLSTTAGWKYAGLSTNPNTGREVARENLNYVLPSLFAETVSGATNPVLGKLPLDKRIPAYISAFGSDVQRVIARAVKDAERARRNGEDRDDVDELAKRRSRK